MANETHLLLTAIGSYNDPILNAETWAVNVRLALVFGNVDPVGVLPQWVPNPQNENRTESDWTITGNWKVVAGLNTFSPDDYLNDQAAPAFSAWASNSRISSTCRMTSLKLSPIVAPLGHLIPAPPYAQGSPMVLNWTQNLPVGGAPAAILPLQNALVMSHRTSAPGRHGRGRMFRPGLNPANNLTGTGYVNTVATQDYANAQATLLEALQIGTSSGEPNVRAIITGKPFSRYAIIDQVRCGNVVDTQRRRRRSLPETSSVATVTY